MDQNRTNSKSKDKPIFINREKQLEKHAIREEKQQQKFNKRLDNYREKKWKQEQEKKERIKSKNPNMTEKQETRELERQLKFMTSMNSGEAKKITKEKEMIQKRRNKFQTKLNTDLKSTKKFLAVRNKLNLKLKKVFSTVTARKNYPQFNSSRERMIFNNKTTRYEIPGKNYKDIKLFLSHIQEAVIAKIDGEKSMRKTRFTLNITMKKGTKNHKIIFMSLLI